MCAQCDPVMELGEDNHTRDEFILQIAMLMDLVILASSLETLTGKKGFRSASQTFVTF